MTVSGPALSAMSPAAYPWGYAFNLTLDGQRFNVGSGPFVCTVGGVSVPVLAVNQTRAVCAMGLFVFAPGTYQVNVSNDGGLTQSGSLSVTIYGARRCSDCEGANASQWRPRWALQYRTAFGRLAELL
jgi:hypothetical protein